MILTPEETAKEIVRRGVDRFYLDRVTDMLRHISYDGNMNQPKTQPRGFINVKVEAATNWPLTGSVEVMDNRSNWYTLDHTKKGFVIRRSK